MVRVLQNLPDTLHGRLHLVTLTNCSGGEPFDVEKSIITMAGKATTEVKEKLFFVCCFAVCLFVFLFVVVIVVVVYASWSCCLAA